MHAGVSASDSLTGCALAREIFRKGNDSGLHENWKCRLGIVFRSSRAFAFIGGPPVSLSDG